LKRAHVAFDPAKYRFVGRGAGGLVRGQEIMIDSVVLDGKRVENLRGVVLQGADVSLLGQNYLRHLTVTIDRDRMTLR
jgi:aspartyl protease family protein